MQLPPAHPVYSAALQVIPGSTPAQAPVSGGGDSALPLISGDGRFVLFASTAYNLVALTSTNPGAVVPRLNVFLRDRTNGSTMLVSANLGGTGGGNGDSFPVQVSTNGRFALFESSASDLVAGDSNNVPDIFVRDLLNGTNLLVSVAMDLVKGSASGGAANGASRSAAMTPDGRYVTFVSEASNLVAGDTNGIPDIFVRDLPQNVTMLASPGARPTSVNAGCSSEAPDITPDGRYVAFFSTATNLVTGARASGEIFVRDLVGGATYWASTNAQPSVLSVFGATSAVSFNHAISADGKFVAYEASPVAFSPAPTAGVILRYELATGLTVRVNTNARAMDGPYEQRRSLDMTPDGRFIAFVANTNGTGGGTNCIYVWDAQSANGVLASGDANNRVPTNSTCEWPSLEPSGRYVVFLSTASGLVTNSLSGVRHLYRRDLQTSSTALVDVRPDGSGAGVSGLSVPHVSDDGRYVVFEGFEASLVANDLNRFGDVFIRDLQNEVTELISGHGAGLPSLAANGASTWSGLGLPAHGRWVAFASDADNLVGSDTNGCRDVFVRDIVAGTNVLVSAAPGGMSANGPSGSPSISADGRYVAFTSSADNLVANDANNSLDVFVRDMQTRAMTLASPSFYNGGTANGHSYAPQMSGDGRYVVMRSRATDLGGSYSTGTENLILRDLVANVTYGLTSSGVACAAVSRDGRFVAYTDNSGAATGRAYLWDTQAAAKVFTNSGPFGVMNVGVSPDGNRFMSFAGSGVISLAVTDRAANSNYVIRFGFPSGLPGLQFSGEGRFVTYSARSISLNGTNQVYLYDFETRSEVLVSRSFLSGQEANGSSDSPTIGADGRFVAFRSAASDLSSNDTNDQPDVFMWDRTSGVISLLSANRLGDFSADHRSSIPTFSSDGSTVVFQSWASDLVSQDFNQSSDLFAYRLFFANVAPATAPNQGMWLSWPLQAGKNYRVQFKGGLTDGNWQELEGPVSFEGNQAHFNDPTRGVSARFYRIVAY